MYEYEYEHEYEYEYIYIYIYIHILYQTMSTSFLSVQGDVLHVYFSRSMGSSWRRL